jgi:hypothetical protein
MKTIHRKKNQRRGDQIGYPTYIDPHISFTPSFGFALPEPSLLLIVFIKVKSLVENKIQQANTVH